MGLTQSLIWSTSYHHVDALIKSLFQQKFFQFQTKIGVLNGIIILRGLLREESSQSTIILA